MMSNSRLALAGMLAATLLTSAFTPSSVAAVSSAAPQTMVEENGFSIPRPLIPVTERFSLKNGLRVVLSEDHSVPVVSTVIVYDVGARDEQKGRSGFAHLFEHMMFEGSENVGKADYFKYIQATGGSVNASTHADFTNYFEKVPSNQLELALWLESDRMKSLKVTQENFDNQLSTVKEEKRLRIDNQPYIPANLRMEEVALDNWSNAHAVIGSFEDLDASSIDDVRNFFQSHYAPNNAVLAIVGDFDPKQARALVERYFGTIPAHPIPPTPNLSEPKQTKEKTLTVEDAHAQMPAFWITFKAPGRREDDYYALNLLQKILSSGTSSRFYQRMVKGDQIALSADISYEERRGPSLFENFVIYKPSTTNEKAKAIIWEELEKVKNTPVTQTELDKAKNQILRDMFSSNSGSSLQRSLSRGELLAEYTSFFGDPGLLDKDVQKYLSVTPADIQRVAQRIFRKEGATTVDVVPTGNKAESQAK